MAMRRSLSPTDLAQKAFVRGLPEDADEEAIRRLFAKYGTVTEGKEQILFNGT
jgi:RNA recognition motif-containing protein